MGRAPDGAFAGSLNLLVMIVMTSHPFSCPNSFDFQHARRNDLAGFSLRTLFLHLLRRKDNSTESSLNHVDMLWKPIFKKLFFSRKSSCHADLPRLFCTSFLNHRLSPPPVRGASIVRSFRTELSNTSKSTIALRLAIFYLTT